METWGRGGQKLGGTVCHLFCAHMERGAMQGGARKEGDAPTGGGTHEAEVQQRVGSGCHLQRARGGVDKVSKNERRTKEGAAKGAQEEGVVCPSSQNGDMLFTCYFHLFLLEHWK